MSFVDTVLYLSVSLTTVRRTCRTLKIGRYREQSHGDQGQFLASTLRMEYVEMMLRFLTEGRNLYWIASELSRMRVNTKNGGEWYAKTVSQILQKTATKPL